LPFHGALLDVFRGGLDIVTDFIPGGDLIDDILGLDNGGPGASVIPVQGQVGGVQPTTRFPGSTMPGVAGSIAPGCQVVMPLQLRQVAQCRAGFVAVDTDGDGITDTCMLMEVAIACGLWKRRPKPLLTASDRRVLAGATRVMKKVDTVVAQTNKLRGQPRLTKSRPSRH